MSVLRLAIALQLTTVAACAVSRGRVAPPRAEPELAQAPIFVDAADIVVTTPDDSDEPKQTAARDALIDVLSKSGYRVVDDKTKAALVIVAGGNVQSWTGGLGCMPEGCWVNASARVYGDSALLATSTTEDGLIPEVSNELVAKLASDVVITFARAWKPASDVSKAEVKSSAEEAVVIAVFDIDGSGSTVEPATLAKLTTYLSTRLAEHARFKVVPRDELRTRLQAGKADSYAACVDEACQIELGKAVAAQKSLATKLLRIGNTCAMTSTLYDLRAETTDRAASAKTECSDEALISAVDQVVEGLR